MKSQVLVNVGAKLGVLLVITLAVRSVGAQNQTPANVAPPARLKDAWKDSSTGLMWTKRDNGSYIKQVQALNYCRNLTLGGFRDWRLPEIDELHGIYDPLVVSGSFSNNGRSYEVHLKGGIQVAGCCGWSATRGSRSGEAWLLTFISGGRDSFEAKGLPGGQALCVRRAVE